MNITISTAKTVVTRFAGRAGLQITKHLPEILTGLGIAGGIATVVTAAKSTLELQDSIAEGVRLVEGHKKLREEKPEDELLGGSGMVEAMVEAMELEKPPMRPPKSPGWLP